MTFRKLRNQVNREWKKLRAKIMTRSLNSWEAVLPQVCGKKLKDYLVSLNMLLGAMSTVSMLSNIERNSDLPVSPPKWPMKSIKLFLDT